MMVGVMDELEVARMFRVPLWAVSLRPVPVKPSAYRPGRRVHRRRAGR